MHWQSPDKFYDFFGTLKEVISVLLGAKAKTKGKPEFNLKGI